jgi:hypothetical protein
MQGEEKIGSLKRELESDEGKERSAIFTNALALCMHSVEFFSGKYVESTLWLLLWHPTEHHFYPNNNRSILPSHSLIIRIHSDATALNWPTHSLTRFG